MLNVTQLSFRYDKHLILNNLSFSLLESQVIGILGLNGAGKTTALNLIAGFLPLQEGSIFLDGEILHSKSISMLETTNYFYPYLTAEEHLSIFLTENKDFDLFSWAKLLDLPLNQPIEDFSTGMKKKLALLCILILDRPIIILDEPFNGLDLESCFLLKEIIMKLKSKGKAILMTSHIVETLTGICDQILWLRHGAVERKFEENEFAEIEKILKEDLTKLEALNNLL